MNIETILLLIFIMFLIGVFPVWPHSRTWGYAPSGIFTVLLVVFIVWVVISERPLFRSSGDNIKSIVQESGDNIKSIGRDVAGSIRDVVE